MLAVLASIVPIWECPWCLGHGKMAPHSGFVFDNEMLDCSMCEGRRKVTLLKNWRYDPLKEMVRQWPDRLYPRR